MGLELRGVSYRYAGAAAVVLREIDLHVAAGEVVGIVGRNDAGKSTLCLVAAGLAPNAIGGTLQGSVLLDGTETRTLAPARAAERCGIVFQNPVTQLSGTAATVWEEIAFGPRNLGLPLGDVVDRVEWALSAIAVEGLASRDPERLSGGQAQLVALASVLALRPGTLVVDEPTSLLDPAGTRLVGMALARLAKETGAAIVIVEHKTDLLARIADRVGVLEHGRLVALGPTETVLSDPALADHGVEVPTGIALRRAAAAAGVVHELPPIADLEGPALRATEATSRGAGAPLARRPSPSSLVPALGAIDLGFVYPTGTEALTSVDLTIEQGERVALVGQNGSGKSTLVRHWNGLLRATRGEVLVNATPVGRRHVAALAAEVGLAFQNPDSQVFARRVQDEVSFGPRNLGRRGAELDIAVASGLDVMGFEQERDANPFDLGFSRRKLLSIASVLAMETPIVILDEPTTGQDAGGVERVAGAIERLHQTGRTVVAISHDMRFVAEHFDRVVVMRQGRVVLDAPPPVAFDEPSWDVLASSFLEPPLPAVIGARLGLGGSPTIADVIRKLVARSASHQAH